jgi:CBS domain-containing protein
MESVKVTDLMVPLEEYATVSEDATLYEAVLALEEAQRRFDQNRYRHRAILVLDQNKKVVGKVSQLDILKSLEPKYAQLGEFEGTSRYGFSAHFINSMKEKYGLWQKPLDDICRKAARRKVRDIMYAPTEGEYVEADASLNTAIHQLVMGHHQSLLVIQGKKIVGVLRLADVFKEITDRISKCQV